MPAIEEPISKTKIIVPRRRVDLLSRSRLLEILFERLDRRLIIISAGAGYGKTSLLIDLVNHCEWQSCWLALDALDRDPQRFIAGVIASINESFPEFGKQSKSLLSSMTSLEDGMERVLVTLINEIFADIHEQFILVLDDFHVLDETPPILYFVNRFVQLVGENCHVILSSRTLPGLHDIPLLVAREEVGGLDFSDLAFQPGEIQALLAQNRQIHLSDEDAKRLVDSTEGWITGIQFADLSQLGSGAVSFRAPQRVGVTVFDYLGQQVLEQQTDEMQQFLLRSSILGEFDINLCATVLGPLYKSQPDWSRLIDTLTQKNLFTLPVGTNGQWLRYHHLFRDYLQDRFRRECPQEIEQILRRLAQVDEGSGQWEKAYQIYNELGDMEALPAMIERAGIPMYQHALVTLESWLKALPPSVANSRPGLLSLRGNTELVKGNAAESVRLFDRAIRIYRAEGQKEGLALALVRRGSAYRVLGRYDDAMQDAEEVLKTSESDDQMQWLQADALRVEGACLYRLGHTVDALRCFQQALDIYERVHDAATIPLLLMETGLALVNLGKHAEAKASYEKALKLWKDEGNLSWQASLLNNYGVLHQQLGEYEEAAQSFEEGLLCAQQSGHRRMEAFIFVGLGDLYAEVGDLEMAAENYRQASDLTEQLGEPFLQNYLRLVSANLALLNQDPGRAQQLIERAAGPIQNSRSDFEGGLLELLRGRLELQYEKPLRALPALKEARRLFVLDGHEMESIWAAVWLAAAEYEAGEHVTAREHIRQAVPNANQVPHAAVVAARQAMAWLGQLRMDPELRAHLRGLFDKVDRLEGQLPPVRRQLRRLSHAIEMPTPKLVVKAFGAGQVWANGQLLGPKDWQTQSVRELFFFFLAAGRPVGREQIGGALWPGTEEPSKFKMRFKNEIYRLRRAVGLETILFDGGESYQFNRTVDHEYDVEAFEAYLKKATAATRVADKIDFYQRAVDLVDGKYLGDISSAWIMPDQERLFQSFLEAATSLAELYLKEGQTAKARDTGQKALAQDGTYEALYRLMMRVYDRLGDRPSVVHYYKACEAVMQKAYGVPPSPETQDLYRKLTNS
ncbi:MAG TPA: tetratricopeptide repeat protein [Anaerolineales bacterium]